VIRRWWFAGRVEDKIPEVVDLRWRGKKGGLVDACAMNRDVNERSNGTPLGIVGIGNRISLETPGGGRLVLLGSGR